ncbi:unnamed protein product [Chilo suppressalis]|uniref:DUF3677 domain-containing protein n=1 Tax=Chilo suppressalis TaxID=168631 RepID=A0ABN8B0L1_CHISP|nr:unnamed protein product [Chilo suppressalis]
MERGKMTSTGRGGKSKAPQHPQDIFALGSKSTVVVNRDSEKRNIHKPSTSGVERKRETTGFGSQPPTKRSRIGSPAEAVGGTSLEVDPVDLVPNVLQALDTHNSDKLLGLLTGSIRLLKSQRSKPDPILCMSMLYLTKIRPNMFAHETVTQSLCTLLKREQGAAFKSKGNPLVFVLACNMLYAGHKDSNNWPDTFIKVYIEDALNERWWVECSWCKCLVENIVTAFSTKHPPPFLIPSDNTLGTMSPSGSGSPLMGSTDEDPDNTELEYTVFPRYSSSYETVEALVLEAIKEQIQRRAAPDAIHRGFLKLLAATCGFPEIRMISASRLEAWLHSGKLWRCAQELLAYVCCNADACGPTAARDHEVLAQLARMRLKTKPLQQAYQACLREMVSDSPALLRSVVTHTIYNELSNVRSPNNMAVLAALIQAQPQLAPAAMADTFHELLLRPEDYLRSLRALARECARAARADSQALLPLARALANAPPHDPPAEVRERAFSSLADLFCCCCLVTATHSKYLPEYKQQICGIQGAALGWMLETAGPVYRPSRHDYQHALNKIMFVESAEVYSKCDNWPPESERTMAHRVCCEAPLPHHNLLRIIFIGLSKDIPVAPAEALELVEQLVRRACSLPPEDNPLVVDKLDIADYIFQLCQFNPPENITLPPGYTAPALAITGLYWRGWALLLMLAAHNPATFAARAAAAYPTLRALIEMCITTKPSIEWGNNGTNEMERAETERAAILQLEAHLAAASCTKHTVTEHSSRLLSQLTTLDPLGPARKPPQSVIETIQALNTQLRLGRLLCRQPALLLDLVERQGTRRAMPWLHQLLRHDQLELSVLPVQCLCEFLAAGAGGSGTGGAGDGKAGELCQHLRRTVAACEQGARAVLHYYLQRLSHHHAATRAQAQRGLKLVLTQTDDTSEMDYNADVGPEEWLELVWELQHWAAVRSEVAARVRAACLVECIPSHVAAYVGFLARHVAAPPAPAPPALTALALDLSQLVMERTCVMSSILPPAELREPPPPLDARAHRTLHHLTSILHAHLQQIRLNADEVEMEGEGAEGGAGEEGGEAWAGGERISLRWPNGSHASLHVVIAHAHLKLLCYGPSVYDTNQEMYSWLQSVWVGKQAPGARLEAGSEAALLPDWLRLHLVRSARPALLDAGLRALPAHKLALFIQTFGMPVHSMSALLSALDACPAGAVVRLGVERAYMAQLLRVQRARGARGGGAFAAALQLQPPRHPPDDMMFAEEELPAEVSDPWEAAGASPARTAATPALLATALQPGGDVDLAQLLPAVTSEAKRYHASNGTNGPFPYLEAVYTYLSHAGSSIAASGARGVALLRAILPAKNDRLSEIAESLLAQFKCVPGPITEVLRSLARTKAVKQETVPDVPTNATREQLIAALESATPSTLEAIGNKMIDTCSTALVVDVISQVLENNQAGRYETKVKSEDSFVQRGHLFARGGLGCGLLLDWLSELQQETLGAQPERQMRLMFRRGWGAWRPQLATQLAHRASWRTLHACTSALLDPTSEWAPRAVVEFCATLVESPRVWQGRDRQPAKHAPAIDTLRLSYSQLDVLIRYVVAEAREAEAEAGGGEAGVEAMRRRMEARLPLVLRCCPCPAALLHAALHDTTLLPMLYMQVPKIQQLLAECSERPALSAPLLRALQSSSTGRVASTSATDRVSHALLTALAVPHHQPHAARVARLEAGIRGVWARTWGAGGRALPLCGALLRGAPLSKHHHHLLAAIELLPDDELIHSEEIHGIVDCYLSVCKQGPGSGGGPGPGSGSGSGRDNSLPHRVAALLRRYMALRPSKAAALLHAHRDTVASTPALSALNSADCGAPASAAPPPHALLALQRRLAPPDQLHWMLQEIEAWGSRRGGAWGGPTHAASLLKASAPLAASPHGPLRSAAHCLLAKLLPCVADPTPGLEAILECLDSSQPEVAQSALDKLPELICGMQEHAARLLAQVFQLGVKSRHPVEQCIAKCVATINLHRGC